jgi:peptidoglycan/LPS O-acetylase OafA/YrhL
LGYIAGIEGLRGISVLAVVLYHLDERLLPGGFVGVDIFFVISGFVVALATSTVQAGSIWKLTSTFYRRRFLRILPAALVFLLVTQLLAVLFIPTVNRLVDGDRTAAAAAFGMSNLVLWWWASDYFSAGPELNPFTHTWSLAVEEQFYLTFPFFFWLIWRGSDRLRGKGLWLLGLVALASIIAAMLLTQSKPTLAFYLLPTRFWEMAAGVLLFAWIGRGRAIAGGTMIALQGIGLASLIAALVFSDPARMPFPDAMMAVVAALALICVSTRGTGTPLERLLGQGWLRYFGRISYSLYLWHWGVLVLMRWTLGLDTLGLKLAAFLASWVLAHASWRWIERPARASGWVNRRTDGAVVLLGLSGMAIVAAAVVGSVVVRSQLTLSVTGDRGAWLAYMQQERGACRVATSTEGLAQGGGLSVYTAHGCPARSDHRKLFVVGDSHAMVYQRMFGTVALDHGVEAHVYTNSGCAVFPGTANRPEHEQACERFVRGALAQVGGQARRGDWVFLPGLRSARLCPPDAGSCSLSADRAYDGAQIRFEAARLGELIDRGVRVIIEAPKPVFPVQPMRCSDWFNRMNRACSAPMPTQDEARAHRAHAMLLLARLRQVEPRIEEWDSFPLLCNTPVCSPWRNGQPLFTDTDHVSAYGNDLLTEPFERELGLRR